MFKCSKLLGLLMTLIVTQQAHADSGAAFPNDADIQKAQQQSRDILNALPDGGKIQQQYGAAGLPHIERIQAPNPTPKVDVAEIAKQFQRSISAPSISPKYDLIIMASLSMPPGALKHLAEQAQRANATFIFRGLSGNSMLTMARDVRNAMGGVSASVAVNPPAFKQFGVTQVPAIVIATHQAGNVLENGCSSPQTYIKVSGDVSLDYALEYIERQSPQWAGVARDFRNKIVRVN